MRVEVTRCGQDAEARIDLLRQRAGLAGPSTQPAIAGRDEEPQAGPSSLTSGGHINLFEDLERVRNFLYCSDGGENSQ